MDEEKKAKKEGAAKKESKPKGSKGQGNVAAKGSEDRDGTV